MQEDGKVVDGDANGVEPGPRGQKESRKWQKPRFTRKALMKCCLVKWIIASTAPQGPVENLSGASGARGVSSAHSRGAPGQPCPASRRSIRAGPGPVRLDPRGGNRARKHAGPARRVYCALLASEPHLVITPRRSRL
ncbi:hypothetical protein COCON_G00160030 [Conger conger]|uniref:Uncharacterized protein n=1 Tax=Conger conger TaxID=82655 RepID=A0A9Q1HVB5_CONCO|nr:hypothetical protein COCON_G00160030 [Conger conger]